MWPDLGKFIEIKCPNYKFAKYKHLQLYSQWATVLCNAINNTNIEGGNIAYVLIHNSQNVGFSQDLVT